MKTVLPRHFLIEHPLLTGWLWAVVTVPLAMIIMAIVGIKQFQLDHWPRVALLVLIGGPLFGYGVRSACLLEDRDAR